MADKMLTPEEFAETQKPVNNTAIRRDLAMAVTDAMGLDTLADKLLSPEEFAEVQKPVNNTATRRDLAMAVTDAMDTDTLLDLAYESLMDSYELNPEHFYSDWRDYMEDGDAED